MSSRLWVPGKPVSWAVGTRRNPAKGLRQWQESVGWAWKAHQSGPPLPGPVKCSAHFRVRLAHKDLTNMWKAVEDGLKQVAFLDDDRVYEVVMVKEPVSEAAAEGVSLLVEPYSGPAFGHHRG